MSEFNFVETARQETSLSFLMEGRDKLETSNVVKDDSLTIELADIVNTGKDHYCVLVFKEYPNMFYCGGLVLTKIVDRWYENFDDITEMNKQLSTAEVKIKLEEKKTKNKNNIVSVTIL